MQALWAQKLINPFESAKNVATECTLSGTEPEDWEDWQDPGGEGRAPLSREEAVLLLDLLERHIANSGDVA